jgi:hypothetical protein
MTEPELISDDLWDNYSLLPNPKWYEKQKDNGEETEELA